MANLNCYKSGFNSLVQSALDALPAHVAVIDDQGEILAVNDAWRRFARENGAEDPNDYVGSNYLDTICGPHLQGSDESARMILDGLRDVIAMRRTSYTCEYPCHSPTQERWFLLRAVRYHEGDRVLLNISHTNITEVKQYQGVIEKLNQKLMVRNNELEEYFYSVSHDLKSPLVTIAGLTGMLREQLEPSADPQVIELTERIEQTSSRMRRALNDLISLSRIGRQVLKPRWIELEGLFEDVFEEFLPQLKDDQIELVTPPNPPKVYGDPTQLTSAMMNLISNALKYGVNPGGRQKIEVRLVTAGDDVELSVSDNGPGMTEDQLNRAFNLFQRFSEKAEGSGIGLSIVRRVMERHHGRAWIESSPGSGTRVCMRWDGMSTQTLDQEVSPWPTTP